MIICYPAVSWERDGAALQDPNVATPHPYSPILARNLATFTPIESNYPKLSVLIIPCIYLSIVGTGLETCSRTPIIPSLDSYLRVDMGAERMYAPLSSSNTEGSMAAKKYSSFVRHFSIQNFLFWTYVGTHSTESRPSTARNMARHQKV